MLRFLIPLLVVAIGAGPEGTAMKDEVRGNNQFAVDLYGKTRVRPGNLIFSPYSISTALAMTYSGASGETAREMAATLHFPADREALNVAFAGLDSLIVGDSKKLYALNTANALWGQKGLEYKADFLERSKTYFRVGLHPVDFAADPEAARRVINAWVEEQTHDKIKNLLGPSTVKRDTDLILTNAIYLKAAWATPFPKPGTTDQDFTTSTGKVQVPLMHQSAQFRYLDAGDDGFQLLELPYTGSTLSMVVLLPKQADGLEQLESTLNAVKLDGWIGKLAPSQKVEVFLPRFKLDFGLELGGTLKELGMPLAFGPQADFSGITTSRHLYLSAVIHKAFVEVNEEGTEAAAATAIIMTRSSIMAPQRPPVVFRADHPFLFLIRDIRSGSILFLGRVANPRV
jgi:serpin B